MELIASRIDDAQIRARPATGLKRSRDSASHGGLNPIDFCDEPQNRTLLARRSVGVLRTARRVQHPNCVPHRRWPDRRRHDAAIGPRSGNDSAANQNDGRWPRGRRLDARVDLRFAHRRRAARPSHVLRSAASAGKPAPRAPEAHASNQRAEHARIRHATRDRAHRSRPRLPRHRHDGLDASRSMPRGWPEPHRRDRQHEGRVVSQGWHSAVRELPRLLRQSWVLRRSRRWRLHLRPEVFLRRVRAAIRGTRA